MDSRVGADWAEEFERYERMSHAAVAAMADYQEVLARLATQTVTERSPDDRVAVTIVGVGAVTSVELRRGTLQRYGNSTLGDIVARTIRAAQLRARDEYEHKARAAIPAEVIACDRLIQDTIRD